MRRPICDSLRCRSESIRSCRGAQRIGGRGDDRDRFFTAKQSRINSNNRATCIASSDDLVSKDRLALELRATRLPIARWRAPSKGRPTTESRFRRLFCSTLIGLTLRASSFERTTSFAPAIARHSWRKGPRGDSADRWRYLGRSHVHVRISNARSAKRKGSIRRPRHPNRFDTSARQLRPRNRHASPCSAANYSASRCASTKRLSAPPARERVAAKPGAACR